MEDSKKSFIPSPPKGFFSKEKIGQQMSEAGFSIPPEMEEIFWAHHTKCHLDENGDWKPELKAKGLQIMKEYRG